MHAFSFEILFFFIPLAGRNNVCIQYIFKLIHVYRHKGICIFLRLLHLFGFLGLAPKLLICVPFVEENLQQLVCSENMKKYIEVKNLMYAAFVISLSHYPEVSHMR